MAASIISVPSNVSDPEVLKRFLQELVNKLNEIFGYSGNIKFITEQSMEEQFSQFKILLQNYNDIAFKSKLNEFSQPISYKGDLGVTEGQLPQLWQVRKMDNGVKTWVDDNYVKKDDIAILTQEISDPPTKEEVENIQNKVNEIISKFLP